MSGNEDSVSYRTNPNARDIHKGYLNQSVRYSDFWKEVRFLVAIGPRNGLIVGMDPEAPGVKP